jgi:hypothetical protein
VEGDVVSNRRVTEIHVNGSEHLLIYANGTLAAEVAIGEVETRDELLAKVRAARALRNLSRFVRAIPSELEKAGDKPDHNAENNTPAKKREAYGRGLLEGMRGVTLPYPDPGLSAAGVPDIRPEHTPSYERGYDLGEAIRRACELAKVLDQDTLP